MIFGFNDGAQGMVKNIFEEFNNKLNIDDLFDQPEELEIVTDEDGNTYVELPKGHYANANDVSIWLQLYDRRKPSEETDTDSNAPLKEGGWEIIAVGPSIEAIRNGETAKGPIDEAHPGTGNQLIDMKDSISDLDLNVTIEGSPITSIGDGAFGGLDIKGDLDLGKVVVVGDNAFEESTFGGDLDAKDVVVIGDNAFPNAEFDHINAPNLEVVGNGNGAVGDEAADTGATVGNDPSKNTEEDIKSEKDSQSNAIYANIRPSYAKNGTKYTDVWAELVEYGDGWLVNNAGPTIGAVNSSKLAGEISFNHKIDGKSIVAVADNALSKSDFSGNFYGENITRIGSNAFSSSHFTGDFIANNLTILGSNAFESSKFTGSFEALKLRDMGSYAFTDSKFTQEFKTKVLTRVYISTFPKANFSKQTSPGLFIVYSENGNLKSLPRQYDINGNIEATVRDNKVVVNLRQGYMDQDYTIYDDVFVGATLTSDGSGWIVTTTGPRLNENGMIDEANVSYQGDISFNQTINGLPIKQINANVFSNAKFIGNFYGSNLEVIGEAAFTNSRFTGDVTLPKVETMGARVFFNSNFTGDLSLNKLTVLNSYIFYGSSFKGFLNGPELGTADVGAVGPKASFASQNAPKLYYVYGDNGNLEQVTRPLDIDSDITAKVETGNFAYINLRPKYIEKGVTHYDVFAKVYFNSTSKTWKIMDVAQTENIVRTNSGNRSPLTGHISFNRTINGYPITEIDPTAMYTSGSFMKTAFTGNFYGKYLTSIPNNAFVNSVFTGELELPNVEKIGSYSFRNSNFTGSVNLPKVTLINDFAFERSVFTGDAIMPVVTTINPFAFRAAQFTGRLQIDGSAKLFTEGLGSKSVFTQIDAPNLGIVYAGNGNLQLK